MKTKIAHYSLLASTSVLAVVAILVGFSQYNNALGTNSVATNADTNSNIASITSAASAANPASTGFTSAQVLANNAAYRGPNYQVDQIVNSFVYPLGYVKPVMTGTSPKQGQQLLAQIKTDNVGDMTPIPLYYPFCHNPISLVKAQKWVALLATRGIDAKMLMGSSSQYVDWAGMEPQIPFLNRMGYMGDGATKNNYPNMPGQMNSYPAPKWGYCLDANYVSNYPAYIQNFIGFVNSHPYPQRVLLFGQCEAVGAMVIGGSFGGGINDCLTGVTIVSNTFYPTGTGTTGTGTPVPTSYNTQPPTLGSAPTAPTPATSSTAYTVSVNYDKFTSEAAQYHYTSVYNSTGIKSVNMAVIKLAAGSSLSAIQVISQLSTLGYRPATLSELYSLKIAQPSVGSSVVGLGTNLGSSYGYPTSSGSGASGLGHSAGPFSTTLSSFAAVHN